jgi:hypothetical protein
MTFFSVYFEGPSHQFETTLNSKKTVNSKKYLFPTKTADSAQSADQITNYM